MAFDIHEVFKSVSKQMQADFEESRQALNNPSLKGSASEQIVRDFLIKYYPKNLTVTTGMIIDSRGNCSKQQDIIICDANKTPILYENKECRVVPIETVYAVIEVKSRLTAALIPSIIDNMLSVKNMEKRAYYPGSSVIVHKLKLYGMDWDYYPVNYYVFAFEAEESTRLTARIQSESIGRSLPIYKRIDCCCILDSYVYLNAIMENDSIPKKVDALPNENTEFRSYPTQKAILLFYILTSNYLFQASCRTIKLVDYLGNVPL